MDKIDDIKGVQNEIRMGPQIPLLRLYALHDGQGPPHQL